MPVKEVAQIGAAIGREFSYELLSAVASVRKCNSTVRLSSSPIPGWHFEEACRRRRPTSSSMH